MDDKILKEIGVAAERSEVAVFVLHHHTPTVANQDGPVCSKRCSAAQSTRSPSVSNNSSNRVSVCRAWVVNPAPCARRVVNRRDRSALGGGGAGDGVAIAKHAVESVRSLNVVGSGRVGGAFGLRAARCEPFGRGLSDAAREQPATVGVGPARALG